MRTFAAAAFVEKTSLSKPRWIFNMLMGSTVPILKKDQQKMIEEEKKAPVQSLKGGSRRSLRPTPATSRSSTHAEIPPATKPTRVDETFRKSQAKTSTAAVVARSSKRTRKNETAPSISKAPPRELTPPKPNCPPPKRRASSATLGSKFDALVASVVAKSNGKATIEIVESSGIPVLAPSLSKPPSFKQARPKRVREASEEKEFSPDDSDDYGGNFTLGRRLKNVPAQSKRPRRSCAVPSPTRSTTSPLTPVFRCVSPELGVWEQDGGRIECYGGESRFDWMDASSSTASTSNSKGGKKVGRGKKRVVEDSEDSE